MKLFTNISSILRPVRFLVACLMCALVFFANITPAQAANVAKSKPTDGIDRLQKIDDDAYKNIEDPAMSLDEVQKRSQEGLNEIQGDADKDKMYTSKSSKPAVAQDIEKALDKIVK
jgi:CubicO group peptidase (beta-lactamase class C family)